MKLLKVLAGLIMLGLAAPAGFPALAEEESGEKDWTNTTELSLVNTTGNSETSNFAVTNKFATAIGKGTLKIDFDALRNETTNRTFRNVDGVLVVTETTSISAESYKLSGQYSRPINQRLSWYARAGWFRDELAGIDDSYSAGTGVGFVFIKNDTHNLNGELGIGYVQEKRVDGTDSDFSELRGFLDYDRKLTETSKLFIELEVLENLDENSDLRANGLIGASSNLSKRIALAVSYGLKYDAEPVIVVLQEPGFPDVEYEFDELDTTLKASLVINF